jgi:hypothetical protein
MNRRCLSWGSIDCEALLCRASRGSLGSPRSSRLDPISGTELRLCPPDRLLNPKKIQVILPCRSSSSEFLRSKALLNASSCEDTSSVSARVSSLFAISSSASTAREDSHGPATLRPQAFSASRRLTPHSTPRACFIPQPPPGFSSFRGVFFRGATLSHRKELPPCRCPHAAP